MNTAELINVLARFCGKRNLANLTQKSLYHQYGMNQVDVFVLFGGSILEGGDVLAQAINAKLAKKYIIVGGAGHTTETLRKIVSQQLDIGDIEKLSEAEIFNDYLNKKYGLQADYLECQSTNCGNNVTLLLELIKKHQIKCDSIILAQDATMQCRVAATFRKYVTDDILVINYATYQVQVIEQKGVLTYQKPPLGMWEIKRYISLLMGEIPRLSDDENGYGPCGKNFISHVDIPSEVVVAFEQLKVLYSKSIRKANPKFASK